MKTIKSKKLILISFLTIFSLVLFLVNFSLAEEPINLLMITTSRLQKVNNFDNIVNEYQSILKVTENLNAAYVSIDSQDCLMKYGTKVNNPNDWHEVQEVLKIIVNQTGASYFMILGGELVVPRPTIDIMAPEGSLSVSGDAWYVDFDADQIVDQGFSISRLPDLSYGSSGIVSALETAIALHKKGGFTLYRKVTFNMYENPTPPYGVCNSCTLKDEFFNLMSTSDYIKLAGHGSPIGFYNYLATDPIFTINYIDYIELQTFHPIIIGYYSCNTGELYANSPTLSTEFLKAGATAFVGRTGGYGVANYVDVNFPSAIENGIRIGDALFQTMRQSVLDKPNDPSFKACAGHLSLYGDPTLALRPADTTPPTTPVVTDQGVYTANTDQLCVSWTAVDPESGVVEYQYQILQDSIRGLVIRDWTSTETYDNVTAGGLSLTDNKTYYFVVKARNKAGLWSEIGYSDGITADTNLPIGTITINNNALYTNSPSVTLSLSAIDTGSSLSSMQFSNDNQNWTSVESYNTTKSWTLTSDNGAKTVYAKFKDVAGNWSVPISDTIIVDTTPPNKPTVNDGSNYTISASKLSASWSAYESVSGIVEYQYQILKDSIAGIVIKNWTSTGTLRSVTLTDLTLENGKTYFFAVTAKNGAGLWSAIGYSNGITVDTTAPTKPQVTDEGEYTSSTTALSATWSSLDIETGIAQYQYKITVGSPTGTTIKGWVSTGTTPSVTDTGLTLQDGKVYYFSVKAKNKAGVWSQVGYSDGIKVVTGASL